MGELFLSLFFSIIRISNLGNGLDAGFLGLYLGMSWKNKTFRWVASYAVLGIFCSFIYFYLFGKDGGFSGTELHTFVPLFGGIGLLWSGFFKYRYPDFNWQLLLLFPLVGIAAAVLYQSPNGFLWLALLGAILGAFAWKLTNPRLRATFAFASIGGLIGLMLFADGSSRTHDVFEITLGCLLGGLAGWFVKNQSIKWALALGAISTLMGGIVEYTTFVYGPFPILIAGTIGSLAGLIIKNHRHRKPITFIIIGGHFLLRFKSRMGHAAHVRNYSVLIVMSNLSIASLHTANKLLTPNKETAQLAKRSQYHIIRAIREIRC